jgi:hypothetical protein
MPHQVNEDPGKRESTLEYVSLSAQGAVYHTPGQDPEYTPLDIWVAEMHAFHQ